MRYVQKGFTLIELVVVIVVLGILAAFAIPHYAALDQQARITAVTALGGSLRSASALAHAEYLASGTAPASVSMEGAVVTLAFGYPDAPGILLALQDTAGFTTSTTGSTVTYTKSGAPTPAGCTATYTATTALNTAPTIAVLTTGC